MTVIHLTAATLFPIALTVLFVMLERTKFFSSLSHMKKQVIIGLAFGGFAILATQYGITISGSVIMNVRDSAPLTAGLVFGGPAGLIAGTIGALYRWLCVYWGSASMYTRLACSIATMLAGIFSWMMRKQLFEGKLPGVLSGFGIGTTMEVLHMLLILLLNLNDVSYAFVFVQACAFPMILCNGLALCFSILFARLIGREISVDLKNRHISYDFGFWLMVCVVIAFIATSAFTQQVVYRVTTEDAALYRSVTLYLVIFMEILIYTALFILIYQMLKKKVIYNLQRVNDSLTQITDGNLDTQVDVRYYDEFSELSDHVNATVDTLKQYIRDAEDRMNQELEFARQIQQSSLPSVFPPYPNRHEFNLHATMDAAKEVGGDFYDFYMPDNNSLVILIADVSGKGVPAAMFMMRAKTLIKGLTRTGRPVNEVFTEANRSLCENNDAEMFITAWMGKLDLHTGMLSFVNAGHNPPLISEGTGNRFRYLRTKPNFILAGMEGTQYRLEELQLHPGDSLYLYTDGISEATSENNELFGEERLETLLSGIADRSAKDICLAVRKAAIDFSGDAPQADDITMLCVKLNATVSGDSVAAVPDENSFSVVQRFLDDSLNIDAVPGAVFNRVQIITDEIWSNIVRCSGASEASLQLIFSKETLTLVFRDNGTPFDPTATDSPDVTLSAEEREIGGLGLFMVRKLTSEINYEYTDERNVLTLQLSLR